MYCKRERLDELHRDSGLVIVNGRTADDGSGECTFVEHGCSTVNDYACVSLGLLNVIGQFVVQKVHIRFMCRCFWGSECGRGKTRLDLIVRRLEKMVGRLGEKDILSLGGAVAML